MEITTRLIAFLMLLRRVKFLTRRMVQELLFPQDKDGSVTRDFIRRALKAGLIDRFSSRSEFMQTSPVILPDEKGCCLLANHARDMKLLLDCKPRLPSAQDIPHAVAVSRLIIVFDQAVAAQSYVQVPTLHTEHCVLNPEAANDKRIKLWTDVSQGTKKVICMPDLALLMVVGKFTRAYYLEYETGSDGSPTRVAAKKSPGYHGLNQSQKYKVHFPQAQDMRVIAVCPNAAWRETMRRAMKEKHAQQGAELWLFVAREDLKPAFLHEPVFYACADDKPRPLVKPPVTAPLPPPGEERPGGPGRQTT